MRRTFIALCAAITASSAMAQTSLALNVENKSKADKKDAPVVLPLSEYAFQVKAAAVTLDGEEIPCQLDDLDGDGVFDELCFLADIPKKSGKSFSIQLLNEGKPKAYEPRVYVELMLSNKKIKESNKQDLYISELTVENGVNPYWSLHHHGAAFENELVAYRIYFDHRQTVDIYGKYNKGLELKQTQFYPDEKQKAAGFGDDILWVGSTLGAGCLRAWDGKQPVMLDDVERRTQRIISRGPVRTIVEIADKGWTPLPGLAPIDMTTRYTLYAGHRDCDVDITFNKDVEGYRFATGFINIKNSTEYSDKQGLRGCWGTDWPVSAKDSVGHKRETVGLGIYIPKGNVISEEAANKDNYAFVVKATGNKLSYKIAFASDNETFGMHSDKEWYDFLKEWKKEAEAPLHKKLSHPGYISDKASQIR